MTKILFWNIEKFSHKKFNDTSTAVNPGQGGMKGVDAAELRHASILLRTLYASQPDIIVIIEVAAAERTGDLCGESGGWNGCVDFLNLLRTLPPFHAGEWRLVPPLRLVGGHETVAVFYRGVSTLPGSITINRYFTGPNVWTGGEGESMNPSTGGLPQPYPAHVSRFLDTPGTPPRVIPPHQASPARNAQYNAGVLESSAAARISFSNNTIGAGAKLEYGKFRQPYMVTFVEEDAFTRAVVRNLTLFAVHSPANDALATEYMGKLANTWEIMNGNAPAEVRVLCGDFNLNLLEQNGARTNVYDSLRNAGFQLLLDPGGGPDAGVDPRLWRGFFTTHIKNAPTLWSTVGRQSYYPDYGYGSDDHFSIDNILVRVNPAQIVNARFTILNSVVGTPLDHPGAIVPARAPIGSLFMGSSFADVEDQDNWPPTPTAPQYDVGSRRRLSDSLNYGTIKKTSDHFALYAEL